MRLRAVSWVWPWCDFRFLDCPYCLSAAIFVEPEQITISLEVNSFLCDFTNDEGYRYRKQIHIFLYHFVQEQNSLRSAYIVQNKQVRIHVPRLKCDEALLKLKGSTQAELSSIQEQCSVYLQFLRLI